MIYPWYHFFSFWIAFSRRNVLFRQFPENCKTSAFSCCKPIDFQNLKQTSNNVLRYNGRTRQTLCTGMASRALPALGYAALEPCSPASDLSPFSRRRLSVRSYKESPKAIPAATAAQGTLSFIAFSKIKLCFIIGSHTQNVKQKFGKY